MGIRRETQYYMECDICNDSYTSFAGDRNVSLSYFRDDGWKIGKKCVCPDCSAKNEKKSKGVKHG